MIPIKCSQLNVPSTKPPQFLPGTAEVFLLHFHAVSFYLLKHKLLSKVVLKLSNRNPYLLHGIPVADCNCMVFF